MFIDFILMFGYFWTTKVLGLKFGLPGACCTPSTALPTIPLVLPSVSHALWGRTRQFYHVLSNMALRYVRAAFVEGTARSAFEALLVLVPPGPSPHPTPRWRASLRMGATTGSLAVGRPQPALVGGEAKPEELRTKAPSQGAALG